MQVRSANGVSYVVVTGTGTGAHATENTILGSAIFFTLTGAAYLSLNPDVGTGP